MDCRGRTGVIPGGWPWESGVSNASGAWVTYTGTLVWDDGVVKSADYTSYGYQLPGVDTGSSTFRPSAVRAADGSSVTLTKVRFIKVQTGPFKYGGVFGEISTEITKAQ